MRGILILALGHPYYGRLAHNLAMSLKYSSKLPITLAYADGALSHYSDDMRKHFDNIIEVDPIHFTKFGQTEYIKAKTAIYELSPYSETIFLDADMLWLPKRPIDHVFDELKDIDFTIQNRSFIDLSKEYEGEASIWCDLKELCEAYNLTEGKYFHLNSELIYFKKNKQVKKIFKDAVKFYDTLKINCKDFANGIPDELVFSLSMIVNNKYPHKDRWVPIYWEDAEKANMSGHEMYDKYFGYSAGGRASSNYIKTFYNNLAQFYGNHFGVQHTFTLKDKFSFLPERTHV